MHSYEHALVDVHVFLAVRHKQNDVIDCVTVVARRREEDIVRLVETSRHVRFLVIIPSIHIQCTQNCVSTHAVKAKKVQRGLQVVLKNMDYLRSLIEVLIIVSSPDSSNSILPLLLKVTTPTFT